MDLTISGRHFTFEPRYAAGPVDLTEGEARALNQVMKENLRNNFASQLKALEAVGSSDEAIQAAFAQYVEQYKFSDRASERAPADKVSQMVRSMAEEILRAACVKNGINYKDLPDDTRQGALEAILATEGQALRAEAERRLSVATNISAAIFDQLPETTSLPAAS